MSLKKIFQTKIAVEVLIGANLENIYRNISIYKIFFYLCLMITSLNIKQVEKISKALGDPYRLKIMKIVSNNESCTQCCDVSAEFNLAQSTMSHHIKQLIEADLLIADKDGRNLKFVVNKEVCTAYADYINSLVL